MSSNLPSNAVSLTKEQAPLNWQGIVALVFVPLIALIAVPTYAYFADFSAGAWWSLFALTVWAGISITAGYHRLWAHRAYKATWPVKLFLMIGGTLATQNSILFWCSGHRVHHRHVDDNEKDPYSAKRGFWFSHIGWMLRNYKSGNPDYSNAKDLLDDKWVMFQHNYYLPLVLLVNIPMVFLIGWLIGDVWGVAILGGLVRFIVTHHTTFFINSLAHKFGTQPYTKDNTARDNFWLALLTYGEGYHNYHHIFQYDYRNGVKWWQFDPTKWLIVSLSKLGLTYDLKRIPDFTILKAQAARQFEIAQENMLKAQQSKRAELAALQERLSNELSAFQATLQEWASMKEKAFLEKKEALSEKLLNADKKLKADYRRLEIALEEKMRQHKENVRFMVKSLAKTRYAE